MKIFKFKKHISSLKSKKIQLEMAYFQTQKSFINFYSCSSKQNVLLKKQKFMKIENRNFVIENKYFVYELNV